MSTDAIASWLRVRQYNSVVGKFLNTRIRPSLDESKPNGNATLACTVKSAQPLHHRIFWREETTSASLWEGMRRALEDGAAAGDKRKSPSSHKEGGVTKQQAPSSSATGHEDDQKKRKRLSPADTVREISAASDLRRLARVLSRRRINSSCRGTFSAAIRDANPAVIDMWLRYGKQHGGVSFLEAFRSWGEAGFVGGDRSPPGLPLHLSCHAGSPEVVSVLLKFMVDSYSKEDHQALVNARDLNGRTALHLSSWSPRPQCPGKRNAIVRSLLAHGVDVEAKDNHGRTALHEACRAIDCFAVEILLKYGANPLQEDDRNLTPLETATIRRKRRLLDAVFRRHLSASEYLGLCAKIAAKTTVKRILSRFMPMCDTCRVRPAETCDAQKRTDFAAWVYKHRRWPRAGEGKWRDVRPSCVEKRPNNHVISTVNTTAVEKKT